MKKVFIIAEAGVNHNGSLDLALKLCDIAKDAGADAVKFQTFVTQNIMTKDVGLADYQVTNTQGQFTSQYDMVKALELSFQDFVQVKNYCDSIGIEFMSTPDDEDSLDFLVNLGMKHLKVGSGEANNLPYLRKIGQLNQNLIVSTGMCEMEEVHDLVNSLVAAGTEKEKITVLHCNTDYPSSFSDVNLKAMKTIGDVLGVNYGYSDHTLGFEVPIAAVALGAQVIEKHFTIDKNMDGPDHKASLDPSELKHMVRFIRNIEIALGSSNKMVTDSERKNREIVRKVIVAKTNIKKGNPFSDFNITTKRAGKGLNPMKWDAVVGKIAQRDFNKDDVIELL